VSETASKLEQHFQKDLGEESGYEDSENSRIFSVNDYSRTASKQFTNNSVCTSKYNLLTFLPLNLLIQFTKLANFYFVSFCALQVSSHRLIFQS